MAAQRIRPGRAEQTWPGLCLSMQNGKTGGCRGGNSLRIRAVEYPRGQDHVVATLGERQQLSSTQTGRWRVTNRRRSLIHRQIQHPLSLLPEPGRQQASLTQNQPRPELPLQSGKRGQESPQTQIHGRTPSPHPPQDLLQDRRV